MNAFDAPGTSLANLTLVEAADGISKGEFSAVDLATAAFKAFKAGDKALNSVISLEETEALETAAVLDKERKAGQIRGPLHGVPLAHKDMYYRAGKVCTAGSEIRRSFVPAYTSTAISRLEAAGSFTIGTLNMAEFAQNPTGHNAHFGH